MLHKSETAAGADGWGEASQGERKGRNCKETVGKTNPGSVEVLSASHYSLCVVLARCLCEAERPSDLKVSPFDTMRPPDVCCWSRPGGRKTERDSGEGEWAARETWRETIRNCEKTLTQMQQNSTEKWRKHINCQGGQKARDEKNDKGKWWRVVERHSGEGGERERGRGRFREMNSEQQTVVRNEAGHTGWHWKEWW